jgi:hypothetical protein
MGNKDNDAVQGTASALEQTLQEAEAVLWREIDAVDPETGQVAKQRTETDLYRDYLQYQQAYIDASLAYNAEFQEAQKTAQGRGTWPLIAGTKQLPVKQAYDRWRAAGADKIEQALAIIDQLPKAPKGDPP